MQNEQPKQMPTIGEKYVNDPEQGRSPFAEYPTEPVPPEKAPAPTKADPIPVVLVEKRKLKTTTYNTNVGTQAMQLLPQNNDRKRALIKVTTAATTVYVGSEYHTASVSGGYPIASTDQPLEIWGCNAIYATASAVSAVSCVIEDEV